MSKVSHRKSRLAPAVARTIRFVEKAARLAGFVGKVMVIAGGGGWIIVGAIIDPLARVFVLGVVLLAFICVVVGEALGEISRWASETLRDQEDR